MGWLDTRRQREHSDQPLRGFKLAYPMLSADGTRTGFSGVLMGRAHVYRAVDTATCVHGSRHNCPSRWCGCGFYCFHDLAAARDVGCEPEYRGAVLLEVAASGRYLRHERGLRYGRQRVRTIQIGHCDCGQPAEVLADSGTGTVGWRQLIPVCPVCAGTHPVLGSAVFGRLTGSNVAVTTSGPAPGPVAPLPTGPDPAAASAVAVLSAEVALLQARLDEVQARLDELTRPDDGRTD